MGRATRPGAGTGTRVTPGSRTLTCSLSLNHVCFQKYLYNTAFFGKENNLSCQWPWTRVPRGLIFTDGWYHVSSVHVHHVEDDRATYGLDSALKLVITMDYVQHYNCLKMQTKKSLKIKINVCV